MKKSGVMLVLIILILIISISFISAGWFGDIWNKITGKVTEGNETTTCTDSDGGQNFYTQGVATGIYAGGISSMHFIYGTPDYQFDIRYDIQQLAGPGESIYYDHCVTDTQVNEGFCGSDGKLHSISTNCPYGCENGVCMEQVPEEPEPEPEPNGGDGGGGSDCAASIDIDFNQNVYHRGDFLKVTIDVFDSQGNGIPNAVFRITTYSYNEDRWDTSPSAETTNSEGHFEHIDDSVSSGDSLKILYKVYTEETSSCTSVEDTADIEYIGGGTSGAEPVPPTQVIVPRIDSEQPETCADRISISFDNQVYYLGDEFKVVMEVFDSQGNHLPNYPFYIQMYDYDDGMWHTFTDGRTNENGDSIHNGEIGKDEPIQLGENRFKIYTDIGGCNFVEGTTKIEIRRRERPEPVPCGIGTCIPEEEAPEEPTEIPEDKMFYKCNGCELEDKCYPMGYRKSEQYCSDNYEFISQTDGECDNHFECESNICISGECIGEGFIKKIINWFKKIFGIKPKPPGLEMCSKLLIEKDIGDNIYIETEYGPNKDSQAPLFSDDGEKIGTIKCCHAGYENPTSQEHGALICPYDNRRDAENLIKFLGSNCPADEPGCPFNSSNAISEYKGQTVLMDPRRVFIFWTQDNYVLLVGGDERKGIPFQEDIADVYISKYSSDLGDFMITPKSPVECSELIIEEKLGDYSYVESVYSEGRDNPPVFSEEGRRIGWAKCCMAKYKNLNGQVQGGMVCSYDSRQYVENFVKLVGKNPEGEMADFTLGEYKGERVYTASQDLKRTLIWVHENYLIGAGSLGEPEPEGSGDFSEEFADAYFNRYPSDMGEIEIPEEELPPNFESLSPEEQVEIIHMQNLMYIIAGNAKAIAAAYSSDYLDTGGGPDGTGVVQLDEAYFEEYFSSEEFDEIKGKSVSELVDLDNKIVIPYEEFGESQGRVEVEYREGDIGIGFFPKEGSPLFDGWGATYRKENGVWKIIAGD